MRKILISVLCSFYLFFISCTHDSNAYIEVTKPESHQNQLINYAVTGNYKSDETHIEQSLLSFLDKTNESESRCNTSNYTLKKLDQLVYKTETSSDLNRSSNPCNYEDINFYLYKIDNDSDNNKNYAILSDDKRIGEIICIIDAESFNSDISDNPFMQLFCNNLEDYINQTINTWNSIFPKYNSRASYSTMASSGNYEYSNWKYNKGCIGGILKTRWTQGYPYNTAIEKVKGKEYVTGCGAIAVSQIMTKFEYPEKCSKDTLNKIKKKWSLASNWDGIYDWSEMKKNPRAYNLTDKGEMMVASLVFDVAEKMNSSYGKDETIH
ncbi:MAG: C10 family peptidase [Treponema sp.]|nr:C10 family peptidase [Treponema sp.]